MSSKKHVDKSKIKKSKKDGNIKTKPMFPDREAADEFVYG